MKNILITGGAGFIGSHVLRLFITKYTNYNIYNIDKLTWAGNLNNIYDFSVWKSRVRNKTLNNIYSEKSQLNL